ncbi:aromatic ring-hydroxylating oxygenase subunit alpha [Alicyclobacillus sp. ALC3]|uniref:aromatic ring-hydroxylating oxygenase subunit alpha n=1 Tax=Alicyclobacillus sp. ALC3 TaxID=2796143 RepID=UPI002378A217|nr:aromatic ring-hydroxylating dioxygenase subunit alpha [Alicyclobacillus sp. ALC3]WDL97740.1 Rieske 2Fe-2S domain-containing protein [Alicyclobacillus sp. ALC3]
MGGGIHRTHIAQLRDKIASGLFPQWVITDPSIFELEMETIFSKTWQFLGHESEINNPGDYVTRWMVNDPVLLVRSQDGEVRAYLNSCTHRGAQLCTADRGNRSTFTCPYHGWTFQSDGALIGVTLGNKVYGEELRREEWGLRPIPRVESYHGMIFGNLSRDAESLTEYLGDMTWYLDLLVGRTPGGVEVIGAPHRWVVDANWKVTYENFAGDPYHVVTTHSSTVEVGISPRAAELPPRIGYHVALERGHAMNLSVFRDTPEHPYQGMPSELWSLFGEKLNDIQLDLLRRSSIFTGGIYPTLSFDSAPHGYEGDFRNFLNFRVWRPLGPDKVEIWSWFMVEKEASDTYKEESYQAYISSFGPSGTLEQDDTENWARVVQASRGWMARDKDLSYNNVYNYLMGFGRIEPDPLFPGPGTAYVGFNDNTSRLIQQVWLDYISSVVEEVNQ